MSTQVLENTFRTAGLDDNWIGGSPMSGGWSSLPAPAPPMAQDGLSPTYGLFSAGSQPQSGGMMSQLMSLVSQLVGMLGGMLGMSPSPSVAPSTGPQTAFQNATISSTGDPHLALDGTTSSGSRVTTRYDNMSDDPNLVTSDSFRGGFTVSTQTTAPDANGVTYNQSASVTTGFGATQVTFDHNGNATIVQNGQPVAIGAGQTVALGHGESVTDNGNSLVVTKANARGGSVTTTMTDQGSGVDVSVTGQNVDFGGDVVATALPQSQPTGVA